jgi:hypothetical protein
MAEPSDPPAFAERRFSTAALPPDRRLMFWRDTFASSVVRLADVRVPARDQFHADVLIRAVPGLRMPTFKITAAEMRRTSASVGDGDDAVVLLTPAQGKLNVAQCGREVSLSPGDAVLMLHGEPSAVSTGGKARFRGFIVPRAVIAAGVSYVEDAAMRRIPANHGMLRLLKSYINAATVHLSAPECEPARGLVASHIHDLIAALAGSARGGA